MRELNQEYQVLEAGRIGEEDFCNYERIINFASWWCKIDGISIFVRNGLHV